MPTWPRVFQFGIFWVMLSASPGIRQSRGLQILQILSYVNAAFCYVLSVSIFYSIFFASFASGYWFALVHSSQSLSNFLSLFWNVLFCLYCSTLSRYLLSLLSFVNIFPIISSSCIIRFVRRCFFLSFPFVVALFLFVSSFRCVHVCF